MKKLLSSAAAAFFICASNAAASPMTLNVLDSDLRQTIMLVARNGGLNVSVDDSVKGNISITLNDIEPEKALEIIAKTSNLNLIREGNVYIFTTDFSNTTTMQTYILPIRYGDPEILRKAVVLSLDEGIEYVHRDRGGTRNSSYDYDSVSTMTVKQNEDGDMVFQTRRKSASQDSYSSDEKNSKNKTSPSAEKRVMFNPEVNALVLFGTEAEYLRAKNLLADLDRELKQVSVEARILAIDKSASKNLGVEWMWSTLPQYPEPVVTDHYDEKGFFLYRSHTINRQYDEKTGHGIIQFGRGPDGVPFEFYYGAQINALIANGKAKILSRPNVTTVQGREAVINVGSSVPVPKESITNSTTTTTFEYRDAGIILKYTPRVNADGTITATIHTEVSTPQYVADLKAYRFNTRSADTTVTVRDGEPMIIGGLIGAEESKAVSKIPFLGDLPILGALFRNNKKSKSESELMIFITAHVLKGAE